MSRILRKYHLKVTSQSDNLAIVREFVSNVATKIGFNTDDVSKIELAVDEACANVIKHAYHGNSKKQIEISIKIDKSKMLVIVTDKGKGFNPENLEAQNMDEYLNEMRIGGLGLHLIKTLMDQVDFDIKPGVRNQVKMVKFLSKELTDKLMN
ncbi:MAG: ATP-binding protein [bacterium]